MKVVSKAVVAQHMSDTKTVQNFGVLLGDKPHKLGQVVTMYKHLAISNLTESLRNVYYKPKKAPAFTSINSMCIEWDIDVNFIKKVVITGAISGNGLAKNVETIILKERYYDKNDTFKLENKQQLFVVGVPRRINTERWEYSVVLVGNDLTKSIDVRYAAAGKSTRYVSNYFPELSERGYSKYTSNSETHRNYMSRHRHSVSYSSDFARMEDTYIQTAKGKGADKKAEFFKMNKKEKECLDIFLLSKEQSCIFGQSNFDAAGKCLDQEADGRDIPMGDGVIPQITRYCEKFAFSILTTEVLEDVMAAMAEKSESPTGNTYAIICNEKLWTAVGRLMRTDLRFLSPSNGAYIFSSGKGKKVDVGATFNSYHFQGNEVTFMPDRALSQEYPDHAYGIFLDTGADLASGRPNVSMFTIEGSGMLSGTLIGMGGTSGKDSGVVSTGVAGSEYHLLGFSGAVVFNPYKSFLLEESVVL